MKDNKAVIFTIILIGFLCLILMGVLLFLKACSPAVSSGPAGEVSPIVSANETKPARYSPPDNRSAGEGSSEEHLVPSPVDSDTVSHQADTHPSMTSPLGEMKNGATEGNSGYLLEKDDQYRVQIATIREIPAGGWGLQVLFMYAQGRDFRVQIWNLKKNSILTEFPVSYLTEITESRDFTLGKEIVLSEIEIVVVTYPDQKEVDRWRPEL